MYFTTYIHYIYVLVKLNIQELLSNLINVVIINKRLDLNRILHGRPITETPHLLPPPESFQSLNRVTAIDYVFDWQRRGARQTISKVGLQLSTTLFNLQTSEGSGSGDLFRDREQRMAEVILIFRLAATLPRTLPIRLKLSETDRLRPLSLCRR